MSKIPQLKVRNACYNTSGVECLLYILETSTSLKAPKHKFTRPSLLIKDFSHPSIHWHYQVELGLGLTHLNESSVEVQIKPLRFDPDCPCVARQRMRGEFYCTRSRRSVVG